MKNLEDIQKNSGLPHFLSEDWIEQAIEKLDRSKMTSEQRMFFEMSLAKQATILEMLKEEKKQMTEEITKDLTEEITKDLTEEITKDLTGELEEKMAKKMKAKNIATAIISEITGLSVEIIEKL